MKAAHHLLIVTPEHSPNQLPLRQLALYDEFVIAWAGSAMEALRLLADNRTPPCSLMRRCPIWTRRHSAGSCGDKACARRCWSWGLAARRR